jgi:hypothetical protein
MNAQKLILAAAVLALSGSAFADAPEQFVDHSRYVSTKSRAQVQAEVAAAPAEALARNNQFVDQSKVATTKTRAEVRAELENAYADGSYALSSTPQFVEFTNVASTRSRDDVRNEAIRAARAKQTDVNGG